MAQKGINVVDIDSDQEQQQRAETPEGEDQPKGRKRVSFFSFFF